MILQNSYLAVAFAGIWSADKFSKQPETTQMPTNFPAIERLVWFQIVNTSPEKSHGSHWLSQLHEKYKLYSEIEIIRFMNDKYNTLFRYTIF